MAAQLNTSRLNTLLARTQEVKIPGRALTAVCVAAVAISMTSVVLGTREARSDRDASLQRYVDSQALLALPPVDVRALQDERDAAAAALADARIALEPPSIDPSSDAATSFLIRGAEAAGLLVTGVNRAAEAQLRDEAVTYEVQGIRLTVDGSFAQVIKFLNSMGEAEPGFVPALDALTISDTGLAHAEIVFNVYTEVVVATPIVPVEVPR